MRTLLGFSLAITLVVGIAAAATTPDTAAATPADPAAVSADSGTAKPTPVRQTAAAMRATHKTVSKPKASSPVDPAAGTSEQGTPNPTVTNGGQLAH